MAEENKNLDTQKSAGKKKQKQGNIFSRAGKRIATGKQVVNNTWVVILCILLVGVFVWVLDIAFATIRDLLVGIL